MAIDLRQPSKHQAIGTIAFPPTPFRPDGHIDIDPVVWNAHRLLDLGFPAVALFDGSQIARELDQQPTKSA
jgi:hypothetical protein